MTGSGGRDADGGIERIMLNQGRTSGVRPSDLPTTFLRCMLLRPDPKACHVRDLTAKRAQNESD
jgi:hypothetical protein